MYLIISNRNLWPYFQYCYLKTNSEGVNYMVTSSERLLTRGPTAPTISRELNGDPMEAILGSSRPTLPPTGIFWNSLG